MLSKTLRRVDDIMDRRMMLSSKAGSTIRTRKFAVGYYKDGMLLTIGRLSPFIEVQFSGVLYRSSEQDGTNVININRRPTQAEPALSGMLWNQHVLCCSHY